MNKLLFVFNNMKINVVRTFKNILHYLFWETKYIFHALLNDGKIPTPN